MKKLTTIIYKLAWFIAILSFVATILPFITFVKEWYFQIFDFPRLQILILALVTALVSTIYYFEYSKKALIPIVLCVLVMLYQGYKIFPYTILHPEQTARSLRSESESLRVSFLVSNVLMDNDEYEKLEVHINELDPDIVILLEPDKKWENALKATMQDYQVVSAPIANTYGMILYSKWPLSDTEIKYLIEDDIPSIFTKVTKDSLTFQLYSIHPRPPFPTEADDSNERDAEIILTGKEAKKQKLPVIVAGDFNDVAWSDNTILFQEASGLLDPRVGRGFFSTFHANNFIFRWPLDHLFHSSEFLLVEMKVLDNMGSDHFPIYVELSYEPGNEHKSDPVEQDEDTAEEAQETIIEGQNDTD